MGFVLRDDDRYGYYLWNTEEFSNAVLEIDIYGFLERFDLYVDGKFYIWNETPIDKNEKYKVEETEDSYSLYDYKKYRRLEIKKKDLKKISEKEFKRMCIRDE